MFKVCLFCLLLVGCATQYSISKKAPICCGDLSIFARNQTGKDSCWLADSTGKNYIYHCK